MVTFDEDDSSAANSVLTVVLSPRTQHVISSLQYTHYSWLRCADEMLGMPALRNARTARSLCVRAWTRNARILPIAETPGSAELAGGLATRRVRGARTRPTA